MGLYSNYHLQIIDNNKKAISDNEKEKIIEELMNDYNEARRALTLQGETYQEAKWYDVIDDICQFSTKKPNNIFILTQSLAVATCPEEEGEVFVVFKNGKTLSMEENEIFYLKELVFIQEKLNKEIYMILAFYDYSISNKPWFLGKQGYGDFTTLIKAAKTFANKEAANRMLKELKTELSCKSKPSEDSRVVYQDINKKDGTLYFSEL